MKTVMIKVRDLVGFKTKLKVGEKTEVEGDRKVGKYCSRGFEVYNHENPEHRKLAEAAKPKPAPKPAKKADKE